LGCGAKKDARAGESRETAFRQALLDLEEFWPESRKNDRDRLLGGVARSVIRVTPTPYIHASTVAFRGFEAGSARLIKGVQDGSCCFLIANHEWVYSGANRLFPAHYKVIVPQWNFNSWAAGPCKCRGFRDGLACAAKRGQADSA
jgi:hypothetical protein